MIVRYMCSASCVDVATPPLGTGTPYLDITSIPAYSCTCRLRTCDNAPTIRPFCACFHHHHKHNHHNHNNYHHQIHHQPQPRELQPNNNHLSPKYTHKIK